jgi:hypothetical protein
LINFTANLGEQGETAMLPRLPTLVRDGVICAFENIRELRPGPETTIVR